MYLVNHQTTLDIEDLHSPTKKQFSIINQAYIENYMESKESPPVQWFIKAVDIKNRFNISKNTFAGIASKISKEKNRMYSGAPYGICIASYVFEIETFEYQMWILKHELRHCRKSKNEMFRFHDYEFIDEGYEDKKEVNSGFFKEDFAAIACCDILMKIFKNLKGLEEHLG